MAAKATKSTKAITNPIVALRAALASAALGREREADIILLGAISREHTLLVGQPGTAKSMLSRAIAQLVDGARYFERLLSPTTPPEAVWGPISIKGLREDRFEHVIDGYLADAHFAFLDEIGRASAAIGDSMLHALGPERQALIGSKQLKMPLVAAVAAANTWPEDAAMLDRWTLRAVVQPLGAGMRRALLTWKAPTLTPVATLADIDAAHATAKALPIGAATYETLDKIFGDLDDAGIGFSDRRLRLADKIMRAAAVMRGGDSVEPIDLEALQYVLWSTPDQAATAAAKIVARANPIGARLDAILGEADQLVRSAVDAATRTTAAVKMKALLEETQKIADQPTANGRGKKVLTFVHREHVRINGLVLGLPQAQIDQILATIV